MKRLGVVLFVCVSVVAVSFFFSREREVAQQSMPQGPEAAPGAPETRFLVSGVQKRASGAPSVGNPGVELTSADLAKARTLEEILRSKNDNDPRLDRDFNGLTPGAKALLRARYVSFPPERRNERGTIVFLLGRNLVSDDDMHFMHAVINEEPCHSLADCSKDASGTTAPEHLHDEMGGEVTLAYPQLVALKSIEKLLLGPGAPQTADASVLASARAELENAKRSPVAKVAALADQILSRLKR